MNDLEFGLEIKDSNIKHPLVKNGVFLWLKNYGKLSPGKIIGFYPGYYR